MNEFLKVVRQYAVFTGRARRREYWMFTLFYLIFAFALGAVDAVIGTFNETLGLGLFSGLLVLALLLPSIGVSIRRLHDSGRTGWWLLISLIPLIGPLVLLVFMVLDSQPGSNRYGPNPKDNGGAPSQPDGGGVPPAGENPGLYRD